VANTTGSYNTATGYQALYANNGDYNTASGALAIHDNTTGNYNLGEGFQALFANTTGYQLTATGANALLANTAGHDNTANGFNSLLSNTSGNYNVGEGSGTLKGNTTGSQNTAIGRAAMRNVTTGSNNIAIGSFAGESMTGASSNNVYIANAGTTESGTMRLGGAAQARTFIAGIRGVAVTNGAAVIIDSSGQLGTVVSSARYKKDIRDLDDQDKVLRLRPVTYTYKSDATATRQYGLIAEEVEQIYPELVVRNADNSPESVQYHELIPVLLKKIQQQDAEMAVLRAQNAAMNERVQRLESRPFVAAR
jgi:hypothetical protein